MDPIGGGGGPGPPFKVTNGLYRFHINTGTDPPREAIGPLGSNGFSREIRDIR